jgi:feruloyl esterase
MKICHFRDDFRRSSRQLDRNDSFRRQFQLRIRNERPKNLATSIEYLCHHFSQRIIAMRVIASSLASCSLFLATTVAMAQPTDDKCAGLAGLRLSNANITTAETYAAGMFVGPRDPFTGEDMSTFYKRLPAFCRVVAHAEPSVDSDILVEVWMPLSGWNGKLQGLGNGGFAGSIDYFELGASIAKGYAAVATDTGHTGSFIDSAWARGHPEKVVDFGYRGVHEMTRVAKAEVQQFYGAGVKRSYFAGCSDGGREALMEAQRYPEDYDGLLAGAPAYNWTAQLSAAVVDAQALAATPESFIPQEKIATIAEAVVEACDGRDGVKDGILNDPRQCRFNPATIQCNGNANTNCLTASQVSALRQIYKGLEDGHGKKVFPGYLPGAESGQWGWGFSITGPAPAQSVTAMLAHGYFSDMVYGKSDWDYKTFMPESGLLDARERTGDVLDALNPDLGAFQKRGGKLILYHGWNDPVVPALATVDYYVAVQAKNGKSATDRFVRLYLMPGVQHCSDGPGADQVGQSGTWPSEDATRNARTALENWVEKGIAPDALVATKMTGPPSVTGEPGGQTARTRLLCRYPQSPKYKGTGDPNKAMSFVCTAPGQ